ncbi:uncharacterized protein LOC142523314 isoform X1 [Primulina tabacum]|uniref:uncharacterized protein LOC142523314 isoform X1 n=1 Tax=Primulina tabacum TaxID=48773 RepID=UPI003F5A7692
MNSVFSEEILADKLSKLNSTQQCIETLSHWCIFHRGKAEQVVATWDKQFHSSEMAQKVPLLYLANDILQNSKRKGNEFVTEFWKFLPSAIKDVENKGDDRGKNVVSRLVGIWEERRVFGSRAQNLRDTMLGVELPPPLKLGKKRSRSVLIVKRDSRSIRTKLSIGGNAEKIVSAFHLVQNKCSKEDEEMNKCKSAIHHVRKMENDVTISLTKARDPSRKTLAKELEEEEALLKQCIEKLKVVEENRLALVSQLRDALREQVDDKFKECELENVRTQMQVAEAHVEKAASMRKQLEENLVFSIKPSATSSFANAKPEHMTKKSAAAIAAEVADKLTASSSSKDIMISALSSLAAEEAKKAALMNFLSSSTPFSKAFDSSLTPNSIPDPNFAAQPNPENSPYQSLLPQTSIQGQISHTPALYHSTLNPPPFQYLQSPCGNMISYEYGNLPPLPPVPPPPVRPSYMVSPMVSLNQNQMHMAQQRMHSGLQPSTLSMQQPMPLPQQLHAPPNFRPLAPGQSPGVLYYTHPYQSQ